MSRLVEAIVVGIVTGIVVYLLGAILIALDVESVGSFLERFAVLLGFLAGLYRYFTGKRAL